MKVKSYLASDMNEAMIKIKSEMGNEAVILSSRKVKKSGLFGFLKKPIYEVVAAIDDESEKEKEKERILAKAEELSAEKSKNGISSESPDEKNINDNMERLSSDVEYLKNMLQMIIEDKRREKAVEVEEKDVKLQSPEQSDKNHKQDEDLGENESTGEVKDKEEPESKDETSSSEKAQSLADRAGERAKIRIDKIIESFKESGLDESYFDELDSRLSKLKLSTKSDQNKAVEKIIYDIIGEPFTIEKDIEPGKVIFFVGPTGVGKTTTIAKVAAKLSLVENKKIGLITADTYRIAAVDQLRTYSEILGVPISVIYEPDEMPAVIKKYKDKDFILVDTAGRSHRSEEMQKDLMGLLDKVSGKEVLLVISATTGYKDMCSIVESYSFLSDYKVVVTKLDETASIGGVLGLKMLTDKPLTYFTVGQNVPDDIEVANGSRIVSRMMGE